MANVLEKKPLFRVKTCATSANIGPGYDIAALALEIFNECEVYRGEGPDHSIEYAGPYAEELDLKKDLVVPAVKTALDQFAGRIKVPEKITLEEKQKDPEEGSSGSGEASRQELQAGEQQDDKPGEKEEGLPLSLEIKMTVNIPPQKGLGSSASAVTAGFLIANRAYNMGLNKKELFHAATEMESSPDNAAAALSGGMAIVYRDGEEYLFEKIDLGKDYKVLLFVPLEKAGTKEARKLIPKKVPMEDAIYNISNFSLLVKYLEEGSLSEAAVFSRDYMYQKYRKDMYPSSLELVRELIENYSIPAFISGSGPAVTAIMDEDMFSNFKEIRGRLAADFLSFQIMVTSISENGSSYF